jgi:hypothetical protein
MLSNRYYSLLLKTRGSENLEESFSICGLWSVDYPGITIKIIREI